MPHINISDSLADAGSVHLQMQKNYCPRLDEAFIRTAPRLDLCLSVCCLTTTTTATSFPAASIAPCSLLVSTPCIESVTMGGEDATQDRLRAHASNFEGLLSLIPAKMYYGEEGTDQQWQRKKQSKAQAKANKRAKLNPDAELNKSAQEIMEERAKNKRKARDMEALEDDDDAEADDAFEVPDGVELEKPGEGLKKKKQEAEANKKQKREQEDAQGNDDWEDEEDKPAAEAKADDTSKLSKKQAKIAAKKEKKKEKKAKKQGESTDPTGADAGPSAPSLEKTPRADKKQQKAKPSEDQTILPADPSESEGEEAEEEEGDAASAAGEPAAVDFSGLVQADENDTAPSSSNSPVFEAAQAPSTSTSVSSTVPPSEKPKHIKLPTDTTAIRARLAAKIEALRAARKADGPDGKPIRTRQELIESRRAKEAARKAHKKELRTKARMEEQLKREEALASNSPSVMSPAVELDSADANFSFGRVAFGDGSQLSRDLSHVLSNGKKKGPSDPKTALLKVQSQKQRLAAMDAEKQKDIAEKEAWLTARRRAEGEKIRDDEGTLKKAVKRKETAKRKSEKAWKERQRGVEHAQRERQKKREDNIRQRKEDKMLGKAGKKKKGGAGGGGGGKKKGGRPGFEGSLGGGRKK
ncbi:surfeit locus protein 6-domain-containing protein [Emericellopsis atlantica]|uniref:Surfeit locus protein 6-domain-containing protein n=1 Tax=Emericellopsis atlantica TaxID=2614577 RepID=A0A9P8CK49_9HYPO|nr:surfeit locus protein 6-domain-containing protein [Emericellopsis atlantica]KAG9250184.1 surfeit locus protein 6-domain-containing protein [Emericellopsis atlantica]